MLRWLAIGIMILPATAPAALRFPGLDIAAVPHLSEQSPRLYGEYVLANAQESDLHRILAATSHRGRA